MTDDQAADVALGMVLRSYAFDTYKTKKGDDPEPEPREVTIAVSDPAAASARWEAMKAVADGTMLARDLVNEPPNVLGPVEFAERARRAVEARGRGAHHGARRSWSGSRCAPSSASRRDPHGPPASW